MKKYIYFLLVCLFIIPFVLISCDDDEDNTPVVDPGVEITLEKDEVEVGAGQIISINILTGNGGYQVTSQDQAVVLASLSDEKMITLKAATTDHATATVLVKDSKGREKELTVTVLPEPVDPVVLRLNKADLKLLLNTSTETVEVKIISGNSGYKIEYVENAAEFITVDMEKIETEGTFVIKGITVGSAVIKVIDSQEKEAILPITIIEDKPLHITGAGSEDGQWLKEIEQNVFEIYTRIEADQPFYFYSISDGEERIISLNSDGKSFSVTTEPEGATLPETSIYRIKLNFNTYAVSIEQIGKLVIHTCWEQLESELNYIGKGIWKVENYNVRIQPDERYKFIFKVNGANESWGQSASIIEGNRISITNESYRNMMPLASNEQWPARAFKFPNELYDRDNRSRYFADVTVSLTADKNYTHDFDNIIDSLNP